MLKRAVSLLLFAVMLLSAAGVWAAYRLDITDESVVLKIDSKKALVRGTETAMDVAPIIRSGRTLLPMRFVAEQAAKATVTWDDAKKEAYIRSDKGIVSVTVGVKEIVVNGKTRAIDVPASIVDSRILLPLRAVVEALGMSVYWDEANRMVLINDYPFPDMTEEMSIVTAKWDGTYVPPVEEVPADPTQTDGETAKNYTVLFEENFNGSALVSPGEQQNPENAKLEAGFLNMNAKTNVWSTYYPKKKWPFTRFTELKLTTDIECRGEVPGGHAGIFVGARTEYTPIPVNNGSFWVAFNDQPIAYVYAGDHVDGAVWTNTTCEIPIPAGITEKSTVEVVDAFDEITYYLNGQPVVRVAIDGDVLKIYNGAGEQVTTASNQLKSSGHFKLFSHLCASKVHDFKVEGVAK